MPKISTVSVEFGRKIQTKPYESADAKVSLSLAFDHEEETRDLDEEISDAMDRAVAHVEATLNIANSAPAAKVEQTKAPAKSAAKPKEVANAKTATTTAKPKAAAKPGNSTKPAAAKKPGAAKPAAGKPTAPGKPKPASPAPETTDAGSDESTFTKGDMMKAISQTLTALQKKGVTDGSEQIDTIVRAYLTDDKPPYSYARIPENSWGDFIKDVEDLKNAA